jgi:UDP-N-acetylglucosamine--N-acetylmuramyl-(pentapeptide) pyrophosphoryl-undecaprenol N-acetylglucosamine transferase
MALAASTMHIPAALSEADAHLGLANRMALPFAKTVFLSYPLEGRHEPRFRVVGRPIPARARPISTDEAREIFELPPDGPLLLVAGALAGARSINETMIEAFGEIGPAVLHISGERDYWSLKARVRRGDYRLIPSTERIGAAYSAADLVVTRAGSSVWELAAAGKPAILVPYPFATADHQALNAEYFVKAGGAMMIRDLDLDDVPDRVRSLLDDAPRLEEMGAAMLRVAKPNAADEIAEGLIALAGA